MKNMRLICFAVLFVIFSGCAGNGSLVSDWDLTDPVKKRGEEVVKPEQIEEIKKERALGSGMKEAGESRAGSGGEEQRPVLEKKQSLSQKPPVKPPEISKVKLPEEKAKQVKEIEISAAGQTEEDKSLKTEAKVQSRAPEKRPEARVSAVMTVTAEKALAVKKSVDKKQKGLTPKVAAGPFRQIIIPDQSIKGVSQFSPKVLRVKVGERVVWINQDLRTHFINKKPEISSFSVMVDVEEEEEEEETSLKDEGFSNSPLIKGGETWEQVFKKKGTYKYYCFTHPLEMRGTIIVE